LAEEPTATGLSFSFLELAASQGAFSENRLAGEDLENVEDENIDENEDESENESENVEDEAESETSFSSSVFAIFKF
jgi:hypothetical protein